MYFGATAGPILCGVVTDALDYAWMQTFYSLASGLMVSNCLFDKFRHIFHDSKVWNTCFIILNLEMKKRWFTAEKVQTIFAIVIIMSLSGKIRRQFPIYLPAV